MDGSIIERIDQLPCAEFLRRMGEPFAIVGGTVRDLLLGNSPMDIDVVPLSRDAWSFAKGLAQSMGVRVVTLSEEHGEYRIPCPRRKGWIDVARLKGLTLREDLLRRDFTVNAIAWRFPEGGWYDPWEGQRDLVRRQLRTPRLTNFQDDPLRILRGLRMVAQQGFWVESRTLQGMLRVSHNLPNMAGERIRMELLRLAEGPYADRALGLGFETGMLDPLFPDVARLQGVPEVDVLAHTLDTIRYLVRDLTFPELAPWPHRVSQIPRALLILGALFHDIGKADTFTKDEDGIHFYGHDRLGAQKLQTTLEGLRFSTEEIRWLTRFVEMHMYPHLLAHSQDRTPRAVARFIRRSGELLFPLMVFAIEDARASPHVGGGIQDHLNLFQEIMEILQRKPVKRIRLITGHDLIALGYPPGPIFRRILDEVEERALAGELRDREEALAWVQHRYPLKELQGDATSS